MVSLFFLYVINNLENQNKIAWILFIIFNSCVIWLHCSENSELSFPNLQHNSSFYYNYAWMIIIVIGMASIIPIRFASTLITSLTMFFILFMQWIMPLFHGSPLLGPVYNPMSHMMPLPLELIFVPPSIYIDLMLWKGKFNSNWTKALIIGGGAFVIYVIFQWQYANLMISPISDNWFLRGHQLPYFVDPAQPWWNHFWIADKDAAGNFSLQLFLGRVFIRSSS